MLGENLKYLRKQQNLSLRELSNLTDVNFSAIRQIEDKTTKNPKLNTVIKLANFFNLSLDDFVYNDLTKELCKQKE